MRKRTCLIKNLLLGSVVKGVNVSNLKRFKFKKGRHILSVSMPPSMIYSYCGVIKVNADNFNLWFGPVRWKNYFLTNPLITL